MVFLLVNLIHLPLDAFDVPCNHDACVLCLQNNSSVL